VVAWGDNFYGQTNVPIGLSNVMAIAGGGAHSLALRSNGTVAAWGWNESGQTNVPAGLSNVVAVAGGSGHSLALRSDGTVEAWGWDGGSGQMNVPTGLSNVVAIAAASFHNLAIKSDGTVVAWGGTTVPAGLTAVAVVASTSFNPHVPGAYTVTYTAVNSLGGINSVTRTVIVLPPALGVPTRLGNGAIRFNFPFTSNGTCTVLASTNVGLPINAWNNLGAALESPASSGHFQFTDVQATNYPRRFYLIRSP
jgi:alpha-tubulin suppressor-like RCC1 family protein